MLLAFELIATNHFRQIDLKQAGLLAFQLRQRSAEGALAILQRLREPFTGLGAGLAYLLAKAEREENREWSNVSLTYAMRDMEDEPSDYSVADLKVVYK